MRITSILSLVWYSGSLGEADSSSVAIRSPSLESLGRCRRDKVKSCSFAQIRWSAVLFRVARFPIVMVCSVFKYGSRCFTFYRDRGGGSVLKGVSGQMHHDIKPASGEPSKMDGKPSNILEGLNPLVCFLPCLKCHSNKLRLFDLIGRMRMASISLIHLELHAAQLQYLQ